MPIGWYIVPYMKDPTEPFPARMVSINQYTADIRAAGGFWAETEILDPGIGRALIKVRAPTAALTQLDALYKRLPKDRLDDPLSDLPPAALLALKNELLEEGYTLAEIKAKFGPDVSLEDFTLRDVLRFMVKRRRKVRYIEATGDFVCDGEIKTPRTVEDVDEAVTED
jgi:hypothetical protein